jgi:hypothetical protein
MRSRALLSISSVVGLTLAMCWSLGCGSQETTAGAANAPTSTTGTGTAGGAGAASAGGSDGSGGAGAGQGGTGGSEAAGGSQPGVPQIGAHGLSYYRYGENQASTIDAPALSTQPSGSTLIVSAGRGDFSAFAAPTDNKGNAPYAQLGTAHTYSYWPTSGTAVYAFPGAVGGANHVLTNTNPPGDEITFAVVEVTGSSRIQDAQWVEKLNRGGQSITSASVTTTGPATLVAFWWGDGGADEDKVAVPNNGFVVLDSIGLAGSLVQCFVAAREVQDAGTYDVTWEATPPQGAQLWLVAVQ